MDFKHLLDMLDQHSSRFNIQEIAALFVMLCAIMIPLEYFGSRPRKILSISENKLNLLYWFFNPLVIRPFTNLLIGVTLLLLSLALNQEEPTGLLAGYGPLSRQPVWLQILEILLIADLIEYWVHRMFHRSRFWKIHAIHHSAKEMNWLASARMHPLNDLCTKVCQIVPLVLMGFPLASAALVIPYFFVYVIFLHSNVSWDFGFFRYVIVSPAYHHWHHSSECEALDKNFAGIFPLWDLIFGTFYLPPHRASRFGVIREEPPENLLSQMTFPFRSNHRH